MPMAHVWGGGSANIGTISPEGANQLTQVVRFARGRLAVGVTLRSLWRIVPHPLEALKRWRRTGAKLTEIISHRIFIKSSC